MRMVGTPSSKNSIPHVAMNHVVTELSRFLKYLSTPTGPGSVKIPFNPDRTGEINQLSHVPNSTEDSAF